MMKDVKLSEFKTYVIMPFGNNNEYLGGNEESEYIYKEIIKPAVKLAMCDENAEPNIMREVDRNQPGSITTTIVKDLLNSDVVIVDVTGRNPNVFWELGVRYALRNKITIVIAQEGTAIPFNIKGYRYIEYSRFIPNEARLKIAQFIRESSKEEMQSDSIVFEVFPAMSVIIPGVAESHGHQSLKTKGTMRWDEYIGRVKWVCQLLEDSVVNGRFTPDALIGISNGGLIVADLVGRELFRGTPILSLWANRFFGTTQSPSRFFDNPYNDATIGALKQSVEQAHGSAPATILLIDDHLGTGDTAQQAIGYLKNQLGNETSILFIPLVSRRLYQFEYLSEIEEFLPYKYQLRRGKEILTKEEFVSQANTEALYFPYFHKDISK